MLSNNRAGAEVVRPLHSLEGVSVDAVRPLQSFLSNLERARISLAACEAASFWWSVPNLAPKIALGKTQLVEETSTELMFAGADGALRILPLSDRAAYWRAVVGSLERKKDLALVPNWAASAVRKHYRVTPQQGEFLVATERLRHLSGGRLRNVRNLIHKACKQTTVERFEGDRLADYLAVNRAWYRQNAEAKFRTYDKTSIDWLLQNWRLLRPQVPDLQCFAARDPDARLIAFTVASVLSAQVWSAYTERFDREHPIQGCNWLLWRELANFYHEPIENDGTADTTALRRNKGKVAAGVFPLFRVAP